MVAAGVRVIAPPILSLRLAAPLAVSPADDLVLDVRTIHTHVTHIVNHGSEDGAKIGSWLHSFEI